MILSVHMVLEPRDRKLIRKANTSFFFISGLAVFGLAIFTYQTRNSPPTTVLGTVAPTVYHLETPTPSASPSADLNN